MIYWKENEVHCEFDGVETIADVNGRYCYVPVTHKVTLGENRRFTERI